MRAFSAWPALCLALSGFTYGYSIAAGDPVAEPINIVTVAGPGLQSIGDGGPATDALLSNNRGLAIDQSGNLYVVDQFHQRVRRVDQNGIVTTFAGAGGAGNSGDGGPATAAKFAAPFGVAIGPDNSVYISDLNNDNVRRVDPAGFIWLVAGDGQQMSYGENIPATQASLNDPIGLAFDSAGNLYIAEFSGARIRKVDPNGIITFFAGTGIQGYTGDGVLATSAGLTLPEGVAIDSHDNVYVAERSGNRVRKVDQASRLISTYAGNGQLGVGADGAVATAASLSNPRWLAFDSTDDLYISQASDPRIRKVSASGILTTYAGTAVAGFSGDGGPATAASLAVPYALLTDQGNNLYISDYGNSDVRKVDYATHTISSVVGSPALPLGTPPRALDARFFTLTGMTVDRSGVVYITEKNSNRVRKVDPTNGTIVTVAGNGLSGFAGDGGPGPMARLTSPFSVGTDDLKNVYIATANDQRVRRVDALTGVITTVAGNGQPGYSDGPPASAQLNEPWGVALDGHSTLYISEGTGARIRKVDLLTGIMSTVGGNGQSGYFPSQDGGLATQASILQVKVLALHEGELYLSDKQANVIRKINLATGIISRVAGTGVGGLSPDGTPATEAMVNGPTGLGWDSQNNLYFSDVANHRIVRVRHLTGTIETVAGISGTGGFGGDGGPASTGLLSEPYGMAIDAADNLYILDAGNERVRRLNVAATVTLQPATLTLNTNGDWLAANIALSTPRTAAQVDPASVTIEALDPVTRAPVAGMSLPAAPGAPYVAGPGATGGVATIQFSRDALAAWAVGGAALSVRVQGRFADGRYFSGDTTLSYAFGPAPGLVACSPAAQGNNDNDSYTGGSGADSYDGHAGDDTISGGNGNDCLLGSDGADHITGGSGSDKIDGGPGADQINSGDGADLVTGGDGADDIATGGNADLVDARDGQPTDIIDCGSGQDSYLVDPGDTTKNCEVLLQSLP